MIIITMIVLAGVALFFLLALINNPEGYQDEDGFHKGRKNGKDL